MLSISPAFSLVGMTWRIFHMSQWCGCSTSSGRKLDVDGLIYSTLFPSKSRMCLKANCPPLQKTVVSSHFMTQWANSMMAEKTPILWVTRNSYREQHRSSDESCNVKALCFEFCTTSKSWKGSFIEDWATNARAMNFSEAQGNFSRAIPEAENHCTYKHRTGFRTK